MKAILISTSNGGQPVYIKGKYNHLLTPLVNKPLVVHQIEQLYKHGVKEIAIVEQENLQDKLGDGRRWGVDLYFMNIINKENLEVFLSSSGNYETVLVLPANILTNLDYTKFIEEHNKNRVEFTMAKSQQEEVLEQSDYFPPFILDITVLEKFPDTVKIFQGAEFIHQLELLNIYKRVVKCDFIINLLNGAKDYWQFHKQILADPDTNFEFSGFPLSKHLWTDVDTVIHPSVEIDGMAVIGKNCRLNKNVRLKGFCVIGNNIVIDDNAQIENSIIMNGTYVGSDTNIRDSIVDKNHLFNADKNTALNIQDEFILGKAFQGKFLINFSNRAITVFRKYISQLACMLCAFVSRLKRQVYSIPNCFNLR